MRILIPNQVIEIVKRPQPSTDPRYSPPYRTWKWRLDIFEHWSVLGVFSKSLLPVWIPWTSLERLLSAFVTLQHYICWKFWKNSKLSKWWTESELYKGLYITLPFSHKGALNMLSDTALYSKGFHTCIFNQDYISHTSIIAHKCSRPALLENVSALCVRHQLFFLCINLLFGDLLDHIWYIRKRNDQHWKWLYNSLNTARFLRSHLLPHK